ncbi:MAG TPA: AraC family transcriptional regulator [Clostridiaceae bacterium]|nr:AraC family transcriptional regulator [Clostridiaceae bacterium]
MDSFNQIFTHRQHMINDNFEYFHYKDDPHLEVGYHSHDFYEIYFLLSGKVTYLIEGKSYSLKPWDILIINNKDLHKPIIESGSVYERIVIWINPDYIRKLCTPSSDLLTCFESTSKNRYSLLRPGAEMLNSIKNTVFKLEKVLFANSFGSDILTGTYLTELIVLINKAYLDTDVVSIEEDISYNSTVNDIIHYINRNLGSDLSLESLSKRYFMSKYHLLREFKKHTGYTLHSYISKKRLLTAKSLLRSGSSISDVCRECGYNNYSNFIRSFTKAFDISPKKYAREAR